MNTLNGWILWVIKNVNGYFGSTNVSLSRIMDNLNVAVIRSHLGRSDWFGKYKNSYYRFGLCWPTFRGVVMKDLALRYDWFNRNK